VTATEKALVEVEELRAKVVSMQSAAALAEEVCAAFPDLPLSVTLGYQTGTLQGVLIFAGGYGEGDCLGDIRLVFPILKELSRRGFKSSGKPEDYPEIGRRTWNLRKADEPTPVRFCAFVAAPHMAGEVCRFVQTGVKEQPVYELLCDDGEPEGAAP
jgi:hypothetical protein